MFFQYGFQIHSIGLSSLSNFLHYIDFILAYCDNHLDCWSYCCFVIAFSNFFSNCSVLQQQTTAISYGVLIQTISISIQSKGNVGFILCVVFPANQVHPNPISLRDLVTVESCSIIIRTYQIFLLIFVSSLPSFLQ